MTSPRADLVVVDGHNLCRRAWESAGRDAYRASVTFTALVKTAIEIHEPVWAAVAFDAPTCFRTRLYPAYKANRPPKDPRLVDWIEGLRGLERVAGARVIVSPDHEADDVLATLAYKCATRHRPSMDPGFAMQPYTTMLVTSDHDAWSLIGPSVAVALLSTGPGAAYVNADEVKRRMGVSPGCVLAYKALVGDASDNIKGIPGVGPVRALKLLADVGKMRGRAALLDALTRLDTISYKGTREDASAAAEHSYELVRPRFRAPMRWELDDLRLLRPEVDRGPGRA